MNLYIYIFIKNKNTLIIDNAAYSYSF